MVGPREPIEIPQMTTDLPPFCILPLLANIFMKQSHQTNLLEQGQVWLSAFAFLTIPGIYVRRSVRKQTPRKPKIDVWRFGDISPTIPPHLTLCPLLILCHSPTSGNFTRIQPTISQLCSLYLVGFDWLAFGIRFDSVPDLQRTFSVLRLPSASCPFMWM